MWCLRSEDCVETMTSFSSQRRKLRHRYNIRCVYPNVQLGLYYHYLLPILTSYHLNLTSITENCHYRTLLRPSACALWILAGKESTIFQLKQPCLEIAMFGKMVHFTKSNITSAILKLQTSARYQIKAKCQGFPQSFSNLMYDLQVSRYEQLCQSQIWVNTPQSGKMN